MFGRKQSKTSRVKQQTVILELTQQCNHNCVFCYNVWKRANYPKGQLPRDEYLNIVNRVIDEAQLNTVTISGGEPLLCDYFWELLELLNRKQVGIILISNGTLIDEHTAHELIHSGIALYEIPLISAQRETYNELCGADSFDKATEAITNIKRFGGRVVVVFVATKENIEQIGATIILASCLQADGLMFNRFNPGGKGADHIDLMPSLEQVKGALATCQKMTIEWQMPISCSIPLQPCLFDMKKYPHLGYGFCAAGRANAYFTIDSLGNLRVCNHTSRILGNLKEQGWHELVNSPEVDYFQNVVPDFCRPCSRANECQGGCKAAAEECFGNIEYEEPFLKQEKANAVIPNES